MSVFNWMSPDVVLISRLVLLLINFWLYINSLAFKMSENGSNID